MSDTEDKLGDIKERVERIYGLLEDVEHELGAAAENAKRGETEVARTHVRSAYYILMHGAERLRGILNVIEDVRWLSRYYFEAEELEKAMMFLDMVREKVLRGEYEIHREVLQPYACEAEEGG
jgi:hypothetical protein